MNKHTYIICIIFCLVLGLWGCVQEDFPEGNGLAEGEGWLYIPFNAVDNVDVHTKATLDYSYENTIRNIYVFIFDASGNKIYGNWLTVDNVLANETAVRASSEDSWWINNSSTEGTPTTGGLKVKASAGEGFKVYLMTNLDADMVKVSSDLLAHSIGNEQDLLDFKVYMNVESINRNGQFPMTGMIDNVKITEGSTADMNNSTYTVLKLKRLDAKIRFVFKKGERPDEKGQKIDNFTAKQWRVINVPTTSYAIMRNEDSGNVLPTDIDYHSNASYFFDSPWRNFEDFSSDGDSGFSFYMLENRQTPKNTSFISYNDRSRQIKNYAGLNEKVNVEYVNSLGKTVSKEFLKFQNANDFSTYVLVTGRVDMTLEDDDAGQTLGADVRYLIHLGNWNLTPGASWDNDTYSDVTNFDTERNHSYTYTVTVNSVNNIRVEVESSRDDLEGDIENQPGSTGEVVIAKEEIALCDAHYESKTMTFHASNFYVVGDDGSYTCTADKLTWKVKTPFSEGAPIIEGGVDIADHLDYKWATFRLNKQHDGAYYSDKRRKFTERVFESKAVIQDNKEDDGTDGLRGYHNDGCMDIIALVRYIKEQSQLYVDYKNELRTNPAAVNRSDFDNGKVNGTDDPMGPKIAMTVFINEFYYDEHPITHQIDPTLWKRFVNQNDRTMHILCDSNASTDMESSATGSVITIQQKSIKTIYNTRLDYDLETAWGTESVQEYATGDNGIKTYNSSSSDFSYSGRNTDLENGRANSIFEWGLAPDGVTVETITEIKDDQFWETYLDYEVENEIPQMQDDYEGLRYICMSRNRDNNGDGKITKDELRWYTASIRQLNGLFVGNGVLDGSARLYNRTAQDLDDPAKGGAWEQIVVSSTNTTSIWAHEGLSTSSYQDAYNWCGNKNHSVRCVRNLGTDADAYLNVIPENFISCEKVTDASGTYYVFTCTHLNEDALRDYNSGELPYRNERSAQNQLYKKFETCPQDIGYESMSFENFNKKIEENNKSSVLAGFCPEGYRIPSQIEMTMMSLYGAAGNFNQHVRTYWSFGPLGEQWKIAYDVHKGFTLLSGGNMTIAPNNASKSRCVRDIRVE